MLSLWFAWIVLVQGIFSAMSGAPPVITNFKVRDLILPGDVFSESGFRLPCTATGTKPLQYTWQLNGKDVEYNDGFHFRLMKNGTLKGRYLDDSHDGKYQCFVKNNFGEAFSRKLQVRVTVAGDFHYANDKVAPVTLGKPIEIPCPNHDPSFGVTYRWGWYSAAGVPNASRGLYEDHRIAVTLDGMLVIMFVTKQDVIKVNNMNGIFCEMSADTQVKYSHVVDFQISGNESTANITPEIYFAPKPREEAREGYQKKLYCLAVAKPPPYIIWWKDGEKIEDDDEYSLPREYFNRLLIINEVTKEHQGNYTCTAHSASGIFMRVSASTRLIVKASPEWKVELPPKTPVKRSRNITLMCLAKGEPSPRYQWFRNRQEIHVSNSRVKLQKNKLQLINVESWHEAVFQCVAENDQGMNVTSTWVQVEDPPTNVAPSSRTGFFSNQTLWIILTAVLGVLLIVSIIIIVVCYKRRKTRRDEGRTGATEETPRYHDVCQSNSSLPRTVPAGATGINGMKRRPTLPPLPQYQSLDPSTAGIPSYEPLDPEQDLNDSGLYEKLDFRSMANGPEYDNPGQPLPEYLELVNDTHVPPENTAPNAKTGRPGKEYYEPMENGMRNDAFNNSTPQDYVPMDESNVKDTPSSPKYYEPMAEKPVKPVEPVVEIRGSTSSADYYQPMADKAGSGEQGNPQSSLPREYYVPMAENNLSGQAPPASGEDIQDGVCSSKF